MNNWYALEQYARDRQRGFLETAAKERLIRQAEKQESRWRLPRVSFNLSLSLQTALPVQEICRLPDEAGCPA